MFRTIAESQTLLINTQSKKLAAESKMVAKFGLGQSPFLPPTGVLRALQKAVHHKEYSSVQGDEHLRAMMSAFHKAHNGLQVNSNNILIAPGSKTLLFSIFLAFERADVLIPAPAWVSYAPQAQLIGHNILKIATSYEERWRITPEAIVKVLPNKRYEPSIMVLNYPGNPDGLTYTEAELKALAKCAKEFDILVISDEIYGLLDHAFTHRSFANYYPAKTITTTGLSKWCGAGGWRFGAAFLYDTIEPEFKQALIGIGSETYSCAPTPVQMAAKAAYASFAELEGYLAWQIKILAQIGRYCAAKLNRAHIRVHSPQGGFYLFPDFSQHKERLHKAGLKTSAELCRRILQDSGVALLPASAFGFEDGYLAARLAYVDFSSPPEKRNFNLERDGVKIIAGIQAIITWIENI